MDFKSLLLRIRGKGFIPPERLLCLDPGETTGWCLFVDGELTEWGQSPTCVEKKLNWIALNDIFWKTKPTQVICENYRVYEHKLAQHAGEEILTLRLIGAIDYKCFMGRTIDDGWSVKHNVVIPIDYQMASTAKGFCTDEKLKHWGFWQEGMRHSRDAIRHGAYFLLFHGRKKED